MTRLLEQAIEKARGLPTEIQDDLARLMLQAVADPLPLVELTSEEEAAVMRSREAMRRGEFASDDQVREIWAKYGQ